MFSSSSHGSSNQPAEVFRKDLISAMKLPDSYQLQPDEYMIMTDNWKPEWEKGVQVPVNPHSIPMADIKEIREPEDIDFKLGKKLIKGYDTEDEKEDEADGPEKKDAMCQYDLDEVDIHWLSQVNHTREEMGDDPIDELTMERIIEECDIQCNNNMEHAMQTEEGLGIEYDEDVICDVCRAPDSEEGNEMVFCDKCDICVHQACYGIVNVPEGSWMCRTCALGIQPLCILCGIKGGAMKSTRSGTKWSHVSCALWVPEVSIGCVERMEPITKISQIPASRWALICVICRERTGACIQCSVKTCKTAYHVTCGFGNGLEMKTYLDEEADVRFRSYCLKHTKARREMDGLDAKLGTPDKTHGTPKKDIKEMTQEERANERAIRIQLVTEEFYRYTKLKDIVSSLGMKDDVEMVDVVYEYWKLKRKSGHNKPLVTPTKEVGSLGSNEEYNLTARMKMFVHLRQDLERVRNLCYMVQRREKLSRQLSVLSQSIFRKQCDMHAAGVERFSQEDLEWAIKVGKFAIHLPVSDSEATLTDTTTSKDCDTDERLSKDCDTDDRSERENEGDASERTAETQNGGDTDAISSAEEESDTRKDSDKECNDQESEDEKMEVAEGDDVVKTEEEEEEEDEEEAATIVKKEDDKVEKEGEVSNDEEKEQEEEEEEKEEEEEEEKEEKEEEVKEEQVKEEEEEEKVEERNINEVQEDLEEAKERLKEEVNEEKEIEKESQKEVEEEEENWTNKRRLRVRAVDKKDDNVKKKEEKDVKAMSVTIKEEKEDSGKESVYEKMKESTDEEEGMVEVKEEEEEEEEEDKEEDKEEDEEVEEEKEEEEEEEEEENTKEEDDAKEEEEPDDDEDATDLLLQINEKIKEYDEEEEDPVAHLNQIEERTKAEVVIKRNDYISNLRLVSPHRSRESSVSNDRCSSPRSADADESDIADDSDRENSFIIRRSLPVSPPCLEARREEKVTETEDIQSETSHSIAHEDEIEGPFVKSCEDSVVSNDTEHRHSGESEPPLSRPSLKRKISLKAIREAEMRKNGMSKKRKRDSHHRKTKNRKRRSSEEMSDQPVYSIVRTPTRESPSKISIKIHSPSKVSPKKLQLDEEATKLRRHVLSISASPRPSLKSYRIPKKKPIISHTLSNGPAKKEPPEIDPFEFVDELEEPVHKPETRSRRKLIEDELDSESSCSDRQFESVDKEVSMCLQGRESPYKGEGEENVTPASLTAKANIAREERLKKRNLSSRIRDAAVRFLNSAINL